MNEKYNEARKKLDALNKKKRKNQRRRDAIDKEIEENNKDALDWEATQKKGSAVWNKDVSYIVRELSKEGDQLVLEYMEILKEVDEATVELRKHVKVEF